MTKLDYLKKELLPHDCPKCKKSTRNFLGFVLVLLSAFMTGVITSLLFWVIGEHVGLSIYDMETRGMKLTSLFGATVYLWWVLGQYDKIFCGCEEAEQQQDENWLGVTVNK